MKYFVIFSMTLCLVFNNCQSQDIKHFSQDAKLIGGIDSLYKAIKYETTLKGNCKSHGKVYIDYMISESGAVDKVILAKGLCPIADSIALSIVKRLKYIPAQKNGAPIVARKSIPIYFKIEE